MRASDTIQGTGVFRTKDILGTRVENPQGENLGNLEDLVIDANTGDVAYAVLSFGGFLETVCKSWLSGCGCPSSLILGQSTQH